MSSDGQTEITCGICGNAIVEEGGETACQTCRTFFRSTSMVEDCHECKRPYGRLEAIERKPCLEGLVPMSWHGRCPECRMSLQAHWWQATVANIVGYMLREGKKTPLDFEGDLPEGFIEYSRKEARSFDLPPDAQERVDKAKRSVGLE